MVFDIYSLAISFMVKGEIMPKKHHPNCKKVSILHFANECSSLVKGDINHQHLYDANRHEWEEAFHAEYYHSRTIDYLKELLTQERRLIRRYRWRYWHGNGISLLHSLEFHKHIGARDLLKKLIKDLQKGVAYGS